jgi:16S rRNA (guanine1207-N2)-methyltransferase
MLVLNAVVHPELHVVRERLLCVQSFKPHYDALRAAGLQVVPQAEGQFDTVVVILPRQRLLALASVAEAVSRTAPGGLTVMAGAKLDGAPSVISAVAETMGVDGDHAKFHARVAWRRKQPGDETAGAAWTAAAALQAIGTEGVVSQPGLFAWDRVDEGSRLLAGQLPSSLNGRVADLGAGWGFLSLDILKRATASLTLDAFEAEHLAFPALRANLSRVADAERWTLHWHDVTAGLPNGVMYDLIVANLPFHQGRAAEPALGQGFISAAAAALQARGRFLFVANVALPYEKAARERFRSVETIVVADGYKVIECRR